MYPIWPCRGDESEHGKETERYTWMNPAVTYLFGGLLITPDYPCPFLSCITVCLTSPQTFKFTHRNEKKKKDGRF